MGIDNWYVEKNRKWIARENVNATFILREQILAIRTEAQVGNVRAQRPRQNLLEDQPGQRFFGVKTVVGDHCHLPLGKLSRSRAGWDFGTARRQGSNILQHFAEPTLGRLGAPEKIR